MGKVPGKEQVQKMSVFCSVSISKPARGHTPIVSTVIGLLAHLSRDVLLQGCIDVVISLNIRGWTLQSISINIRIDLICVGICGIGKGRVTECP
jgi:hypothetical protein